MSIIARMRQEIKGAILAGAFTVSGIGGLPQPVRAEAPEPIVQPNTATSRLGAESPILVFNQETYVPTEADLEQINSITQIFLDAGANPDFTKLMTDRFFDEFDEYFGILKAPETFGFQYSPFGKDNPVGIDFYANEELVTNSDGVNFSHLTNTISIIVGDDGTLFSPRGDVELFPLEILPEIVEANLVMDGMEAVEWESDLADPARQFVLKEITTPFTSYVAAGDTMGNLFLGTESFTPISAESK